MKKNRFALLTTAVLALVLLSTIWFSLNRGTVAAASTPNGPIAPFSNQSDSAQAAIIWLVTTQQNDDGGYNASGNGANQFPSNIPSTLDAILAFSAAGYNTNIPYPGKSNTPLQYLRNNASDLANFAATNGGSAGKTILALTAANQNPYNFTGYNFVISLTQQLSPTGQYNTHTAFNQSLAILSLTAVSQTAPLSATQWLQAQQATGGPLDGAWDDGFGTDGNSDSTAIAIMAMIANGTPPTHTSILSATDFLARTQLPTGGWEYGIGFGENANSTAFVLQALKALGEDYYTGNSQWGDVTTVLRHWQAPSGAFQADFGFGRFDSLFTTVQTIPGIIGKPYPLPSYHQAAHHALGCLIALQDSTTGGWEEFAGQGADAGGTARVIEAIAALGEDPESLPTLNAVTALAALTPDYINGSGGGRIGKVMQGVAAAGSAYTVTDFAGFNLVISMTNSLTATGEYDNTAFGPFAHNEAMLGLLSNGYAPDPTAVTWLINASVDGTWGSPDSNGSSLNVLGQVGESVPSAISHLATTQLSDAGWGFSTIASPNSTSEVVQGLVQQGRNPFSPAWSVVVSGTVNNPADAILAQQLPTGCWPAFAGGDGPFSTVDAILLLAQEAGWRTNTALPMIFK